MADRLSKSMLAALIHINERGKIHAARAYPGEIMTVYDHPSIQPQGRTLVALWERGLVTFDVTASLTANGRGAIEKSLRKRPGKRDFRIVDGEA